MPVGFLGGLGDLECLKNMVVGSHGIFMPSIEHKYMSSVSDMRLLQSLNNMPMENFYLTYFILRPSSPFENSNVPFIKIYIFFVLSNNQSVII